MNWTLQLAENPKMTKFTPKTHFPMARLIYIYKSHVLISKIIFLSIKIDFVLVKLCKPWLMVAL